MVDDDVAKVAILTLAGMLEREGVLQRHAFADQLRENADQLFHLPELAQAIRDFVEAMEDHPPKLSLIEGGIPDEAANDDDPDAA